ESAWSPRSAFRSRAPQIMAESVLQKLLDQVEGSHFTFIRFVGRISRHEWDWSPDDGIPSARDVVSDLVREEGRIAAKLRGEPAVATVSVALAGLATPTASAPMLRSLRERTLVALRGASRAG